MNVDLCEPLSFCGGGVKGGVGHLFMLVLQLEVISGAVKVCINTYAEVLVLWQGS
jgi:hypothetical protein